MSADSAARFGDLACLLPLTGIWRVESDIVSGETSFAWSPGRRFLVQVFDFKQDGRWLDGIVFIGRQSDAAGGRKADISARAYFFRDGRWIDSVWRLAGGALAIRSGQGGAAVEARFDPDGRRLAGAWRGSAGEHNFHANRVDQS